MGAFPQWPHTIQRKALGVHPFTPKGKGASLLRPNMGYKRRTTPREVCFPPLENTRLDVPQRQPGLTLCLSSPPGVREGAIITVPRQKHGGGITSCDNPRSSREGAIPRRKPAPGGGKRDAYPHPSFSWCVSLVSTYPGAVPDRVPRRDATRRARH